MFSFLRRKSPDPVFVGRKLTTPADVPAGAQVITLRPKTEPALLPPAAAALEQEVITTLDRMPLDGVILTASVGPALFRLPKHLEHAVMAVEGRAKRAAIYYDPTLPAADVGQAVAELRKRLVIEGYEIEATDQPCTAEIIGAMLENYKKRADKNPGLLGNSASKLLWESWVDTAWRARASDIHIELRHSQARVKIRVDGELVTLPDSHNGVYTADQAEKAVTWAYGDATQADSNNASMFSPSVLTYAMFKPRLIDGAKVACRFQSLTGGYGPKVVLRLANIDSEAPTLTFAQLGYERSQRRLFRQAGKRSDGLILFTGVTGAGKTMALKTFIETHPMNGRISLTSIEDPIEFPLKGVHQMSAQRDLSDPLASRRKYNEVVASMVRADPDGLILNEIRDGASAGAAQQMVETGHIVATSLHAQSLHGIAARLEMSDIGMSREILTAPKYLALPVYQALVPVLCPHCRINGADAHDFDNIIVHSNSDEEDISDDQSGSEVSDLLDLIETKFKLNRGEFNFRRAGGCDHCNHKGTVGRTVVAEMMLPDRRWLELTRAKKDYEAIDYYRSFSDRNFRSDNMDGKTIFEHTLYKALHGNVDPRQCEAFDSFELFQII